jgi:hypothetical protein
MGPNSLRVHIVCEELAHLVGGHAGHGIAGFVAKLVEVVARIQDG